MLEYLKAENFQVFEDLYIEFHPGLNAIIAPTDSGKSSIIRLLDWIFTNHQLRYNYQNDKSKEVRGSRVLGEIGIDGHVVQRVKGKTDNYYTLDGGTPLEAIYNTVPDPIAALFNMDSINIHRQHSKHFMLGENSGEVGKFINSIVNLDVLSEVPKYAESQVRSAKKEADAKQNEIKEIEQQLKGYEWIDLFDKKLDRLLKKEQILNDKRKVYNELSGLLQQYNRLQASLEDFEGVDTLLGRTNKLLAFKSDVEKLRSDYNELYNMIQQVDELREELVSFSDVDSFVLTVQDLFDELQVVKKERQEYNELNSLIEQYDDLEEERTDLSQEVKYLQSEFDKLMPEVCPLCGK